MLADLRHGTRYDLSLYIFGKIRDGRRQILNMSLRQTEINVNMCGVGRTCEGGPGRGKGQERRETYCDRGGARGGDREGGEVVHISHLFVNISPLNY